MSISSKRVRSSWRIGRTDSVGDDIPDLVADQTGAAPVPARQLRSQGRCCDFAEALGYDLPRLLVGSLGTLGLLGEAIIRTNPVPAVSRWFSAEGADPFAAREALFRPSAVLFDGRTTWVQLEGHAADVEAERRGLAGDPAVGGDWQECERGPVLPPHRWSLRPSELRCVDGSQLGEFVASVGVGTVFASLPAPARPQAAALGALAGRIKHEFDPTGRLNPGRSPR